MKTEYLRQKARADVTPLVWFPYQIYHRPGMFIVTGLKTVVSYNAFSVIFVYVVGGVLVPTFPS